MYESHMYIWCTVSHSALPSSTLMNDTIILCVESWKKKQRSCKSYQFWQKKVSTNWIWFKNRRREKKYPWNKILCRDCKLHIVYVIQSVHLKQPILDRCVYNDYYLIYRMFLQSLCKKWDFGFKISFNL